MAVITRKRQVGPYWLEAHLATGGMGKVFLASEQRGGEERLVVLKVLDERFRDDETTKAMFRDEARLLGLLHHPNVVRALGAELLDDMPYIALEYLAGDNLSVLARQARRRDEQLSLSLVARVAIQVANALDYIHGATDEQGRRLGLVHRDISPQNIFVTYDGRVKVLDFGIAWSRQREWRTATGMLKGKLRYMSPEQVEMKPLDARSDLFSFGVVLWELVAGARLFDGESDYQIMKQICELPLPGLRERRPEVPERVERITMKLLERDPERRYQYAGQVREQIMALLLDELAGSPADEIARAAERYLAERRDKKASLIASIRQRNDWQNYLFGDLEERDESSATSDKRLVHRGLEKEAAHADGVSSDDSTRDSQQPQPAVPATGLSNQLLLTALAVVALLLGTGLALFMPGEEPAPSTQHTEKPDETPQNPRGQAHAPPGGNYLKNKNKAEGQAPRVHPQATSQQTGSVGFAGKVEADLGQANVPDKTTGNQKISGPETSGLSPQKTIVAQEVVADGGLEPTKVEKAATSPVGWLRLRTSPEVEVILDGRPLGKTPMDELELAPGRYRLRLVNSEAGIDTTIVVRIRKNEVTSQEYVF